MVYRRRRQTTVVISGSRGQSGPLPLGVHEQAPLAALVTSRVSEEGTVTEHYLLVLSHPWEHTRPAAATAKRSKQYPHA